MLLTSLPQMKGCCVHNLGVENVVVQHPRVHSCHPTQFSIQEQLLLRNVKRFRGGLVFKAHRLVYPSTLGLRVRKKKEEEGLRMSSSSTPGCTPATHFHSAPISIKDTRIHRTNSWHRLIASPGGLYRMVRVPLRSSTSSFERIQA